MTQIEIIKIIIGWSFAIGAISIAIMLFLGLLIFIQAWLEE